MADANKKNQDYLLYANYSRFFSTSLLSVTQKMWCYNSVQYIHFQPVFLHRIQISNKERALVFIGWLSKTFTLFCVFYAIQI